MGREFAYKALSVSAAFDGDDELEVAMDDWDNTPTVWIPRGKVHELVAHLQSALATPNPHHRQGD